VVGDFDSTKEWGKKKLSTNTGRGGSITNLQAYVAWLAGLIEHQAFDSGTAR